MACSGLCFLQAMSLIKVKYTRAVDAESSDAGFGAGKRRETGRFAILRDN